MTRGISIGPGEVAGYFGRLRDGFEALGVPCEHFLYIPPHKFAYSSPGYFLKRAFDALARVEGRGRIGRYAARIADKVIRLIGLAYAMIRYDVFIFSGYGSFFRFLELPLLRLLGKRIIVVYLGSDARPPYLSGKHLDDREGVFDPSGIAVEARALRRRMARVERYASVIVNHTGTAQFAERTFVRLSDVGMPMPIWPGNASPGNASIDMKSSEAPLRVLHAPSRPVAKGTHRVREAVARMQAEGIAIELVELSGVPNSEVLRHLAECDLVIDQLYSDVPLATFSAEAASFGKPVIVGSLYVEKFGADNPGEDRAPTIFIDPDELEPVLRRLVADGNLRRSEGERNRLFLAKRCAPREVAARYLQLVEGHIPEAWIADPEQLDYVGGWGLSETAWRDQMARYLAAVGEDGLQLGNRLRRRIMDAAAGGPVS